MHRGDRYCSALGLLVPRPQAADEARTLAAFARAEEVAIELPRDLPQLDQLPRGGFDGDRFEHRVALELTDGGYELLEHRCADACTARGRPGYRAWLGHAWPGQHSWGDTGHEAYDLAYSLLCARYGRLLARPTASLPALFDVVAHLPRGLSWRMKWGSL